MEFGVKTLFTVNLFGAEVWITETIVNTWIIMLLLIAFAAVVRIMLPRFKTVPAGLQIVVETMVDAFDSLLRSAASEKSMYLGNWFFAAFAFILVSNVSGLVGMRPPTADFITTFAFAMATFIMIQIAGIRFRKGEYLKSFFSPSPIFFPLNLIGEMARPISLSFRLFGNILAGMILMTLIYSLAPIFVRVIIPAPLHAFFDLFCGALQAYIFCVLSMTFIDAASAADEQ